MSRLTSLARAVLNRATGLPPSAAGSSAEAFTPQPGDCAGPPPSAER